jgi:predicted CXXCH cytochrome family protein
LKKKNAISLFVFLLLFSACSSSNYEILSFFFDGVPDPNEQKIETKEVVIDSSGIKKREEILKRATPKFILHGPYSAKLCGDCHNMNQGFKLLQEEPKLCYECHDNFAEEATVLHGPVAAGLCSECHHPHRSKNEFLLTKTGQDLCYKCHDEKSIKENEEHIDIEDENCITCHDPHGSNEKYLL